MRAWILRQPGGPEAFELTDLPRPEPQPGHVLIEIRAFGLNRSEWFTRIGESPTVRLPRVLGIESVGTVVRAPGGELGAKIRNDHPGGVDRVLELIGTTTLLDSLQCVRPGGVVCMTGILGGEWELASFRPMGHIPTGVRLTSYSGGASDISREDLQRYVSLVERGELIIRTGPVWSFDQLPLAHQAMDENRANGKMVVVVE
jgi:NADPH:quinone reductase-like Zn-dependent oxidoreductase